MELFNPLWTVLVFASVAFAINETSITDTQRASIKFKECKISSDCQGDPRTFCDGVLKRCVCSKLNNRSMTAVFLDDKVKCLAGKNIGDGCDFDQECHLSSPHSACANGLCTCEGGYDETPKKGTCSKTTTTNENANIVATETKPSPAKQPVNTHMLPIMLVMGVMFIGMCVALNLFSRARFRNTRSVFNSPHPLKTDSKKKRPARRTSRGSSLHQQRDSQNPGTGSPSHSIRSGNSLAEAPASLQAQSSQHSQHHSSRPHSSSARQQHHSAHSEREAALVSGAD